MNALDPLAIPLNGTTLIEASAGTGKTQAITNLYLRLLIERQLAVSEILVVTYTNAATAELRARVRRRIRETLVAADAGGSQDEFIDRLVHRRRAQGMLAQDRIRLLLALHGFDEAAIYTIHGFCQRMLQDNAFECGVPFDIELLTNESPLLADVVRDFWVRELHAAPESFVAYLAEKNVIPTTLENLAFRAVSHPDMRLLPTRDDPVMRDSARSPEQAPGAHLLKLQLDLFGHARRELRRRKEEARVQSFDDLLQRLAEALRGPSAAALAAAIRARFRAALIDEFQDTDPTQYDIFRRVYSGGDAALFLIGDPKQAIYAFRGADIFAYLQAKQDVGGTPHTLTVNWRSDPSLVTAVSTLFGRLSDPFVFTDIPFLPVTAAAEARDCLGGTCAGGSPLQILFVRRTGQQGRGDAINKDWGETRLTSLVAAEIARFLSSGATLSGRPVAAGDVAVLCRKNKQAAAMQEALRAYDVPSVLQGDASVFEAPEAEEIERVLQALADPGDGRVIRAALSTALLGQDAHAVAALEHGEQLWDEWLRQFHAWHERWRQRGFVAGFRALLDDRDVPQRLLALVDGERRLTNVLHLLELLHAASVEGRRGPQELVHWLHEMRSDVEARAALAGEAAQIRLERDEAAVKLTTVHKSKGLQYPIVYCPYLWDGALLTKEDKKALRFHDGTRLMLDIGSSAHAAHLQLAEREAFAENLRLLYVALTRAQHRCTVVWGAFRGGGDSALGYVLHQPARASGDPRAAAAQRIKGFIDNRDDDGMRADLQTLAATAPGCIAVADLCLEPAEHHATTAEAPLALQCRMATRELRRTWRMSSFSALAASGATIPQPAEEGLDHDLAVEPAATEASAAPPSDPSLVVLHDFPAGARAGQLVHEVFEKFDFQETDDTVLHAAVRAALARFGVDDAWGGPLARAVANVVATPLDGGAQAFRLRDVALSRRLSELEFVFPVAGADAEDAVLTRERLAAVFARHSQPPVPAEYADRLCALGFTPLAGFLKGFIDLVFEHEGRWYLADYKSNRLGVHAATYRPEQLVSVMAEHHYFLQYHLYVVALHRYLSQRLSGYDYDRHFGGVYYLFVRGMAPAHARGTGVFFDRPSRQLVERLSAVLAGQPLDRSGLRIPKEAV